MSMTVLVGLVLFGTHVRVGASSNHHDLPEPSGAKPVWSMDLQAQGFAREGLGLYWFANHERLVSRIDVHGVALNSKGQGAIVFTTYQLKNGGGYVPGTGAVHFICFESATGKLVATKQWPIRGGLPLNAAPRIRPTPAGNFLMEDNEQLVLYSPALETTGSLEIGAGRYLPHLYWVSTDGRYIFLQNEHDKSYTLSMLDIETLRTVRSRPLEQPVAAASEHYLAMWRGLKGSPKGSLYLRSDDSEWRDFYDDPDCDNRDQFARFLTETVLLIRSCSKLTMVDVEGKVFSSHVFTSNIPVELLFPKFSSPSFYADSGEISFNSAFDGQRFAVVVDEIKRDPWWTGDPAKGPVPWRLVIYDTNSTEAISSFALNGKYPSWDRSISFALSHDGSELALFRNGVLEVFRLGPQPK